MFVTCTVLKSTPPSPPDSPQPIPQGDPSDDGPLPLSPIRDVAATERDAQLLVDLRRASVVAIPRRRDGALTGHQCWAILCRYRCRQLLAEVPTGVRQKHTQLKQRLRVDDQYQE